MIQLEGAPAATWAASTPAHRGQLFALGCRLWEQRGTVLLGDAMSVANLRLEVARDEAASREATWTQHLTESHRELGRLATELERLQAQRRSDEEQFSRERQTWAAKVEREEASRQEENDKVADAAMRQVQRDARALQDKLELGMESARAQSRREMVAVRDALVEAQGQATAMREEVQRAEADLRMAKSQATVARAEADAALRAAVVQAARDAEVDARAATDARLADSNRERDRLAAENERIMRDPRVRAVLGIAASAAEKGKAGEDAARDALERAFPGSVVQDRSATGAQGDLWWTPPGRARPILVEVKNYASALPQRELDKFFRDVAANRPALDGAMLVCFGCPSVPTLPGKLWFGSVEGVPALSVCEAETNLAVALPAFLAMLDHVQRVTADAESDNDAVGRILSAILQAEGSAKKAVDESADMERSARLAKDHAANAHAFALKQGATLRAGAEAMRAAREIVQARSGGGDAVTAEGEEEPKRRGRPRKGKNGVPSIPACMHQRDD